MESGGHMWLSELNEKIPQIFSEFMTGVTKFEELVAAGSRFLAGFHQALESLRRPPINKTSELVERILKANETRRVLMYMESGYVNAHDSIQSLSNLHISQLGLLDHISKAKCIVSELEGLVKEVTRAMQNSDEVERNLQEKATKDEFGSEATTYDEEEMASAEPEKPEVTDYVAMMGIVYSMLKQDYIMQERIISSLNLKSLSGELESYSLMWSLRPFIDDEVMRRAWSLIP